MKAGPKREVTAPPLDLGHLPGSGVRRVDAFAREYLRVTRGKGVRGPFRLRPWQKSIGGQLLPTSGPRPRQALLSLPRGNGKTSLAAVLGAYGLYADGVESAEVVVVASDARQAGITLRQITRMVELEPRLAEVTQVFVNRLFVPATDSKLVVLPAEPGALQGWNPSMAIVDELHVVTRAVWDAVSLAAGKRQRSLTLAISTPGPAREGESSGNSRAPAGGLHLRYQVQNRDVRHPPRPRREPGRQLKTSSQVITRSRAGTAAVKQLSIVDCASRHRWRARPPRWPAATYPVTTRGQSVGVA